MVNKEDDTEPPIFKRMYIYLEALKKGFMAAYRKVVGLDGCFLREPQVVSFYVLLGRDANN